MAACGASWLDTELLCQLEAGHIGEHFSKYEILYDDDTSTGELSWVGPRNLKETDGHETINHQS